MSHIALYRKYRPQSFDQVLGQESIVQALTAALAKKEVSHAYLFAGSRGTGKTSIARIFAKELGVSVNDIYEIDAASNRGINEMKELLAGVATLPFDSQYKVYILDEVHMFTKEAWNALLKTLEEPPKHVIFILATTELHKVLDTIRSRCQVFEFKKPTIEILKQMLVQGATAEGVAVDDSALEAIAQHGNGAFRDTWGIFERVVQSSGKKITLDDVSKILAKPHHVIITDFMKALVGNDLETALDAVHQVYDQGLAMDDFLEHVIEQVRLVLLLRFAPKFAETVTDSVSADMIPLLKEWAGQKNIINAGLLVEFLKVLDETKKTQMVVIPIELALIRVLGQNTSV
jgi:DNA polymerase-3 subunit gamma/tau